MKDDRRDDGLPRISRRSFLGQASCAAVGTTALFSTVLDMGMFNVLAGNATDYKALVCIFFGGGAGLHFVDLQSDLSGIDESDEHLGLNFHAGLDVHVNDSVSLYVVGRFDLVEDFEDEEQAKIIVGVRFNFD